MGNLLEQLQEINDPDDFPSPETSLSDPDGLLGYGYVLNTKLLNRAYQSGIFPWFESGQPVLWWCPEKRAILHPDEIHISKSLFKKLKKGLYRSTMNTNFEDVIKACSSIKRSHQDSTWITNDMINNYCDLHQKHKAQSVEVWSKDQLVGGLYGVTVNGIFCGESMFSIHSDASKIALVALARNSHELGVELIDCQIMNPYLASMGAIEIEREQYLRYLNKYSSHDIHFCKRNLLLT